MSNTDDRQGAQNSPADPVMTRVVAEEEKSLKRVHEAAAGQKEKFTRNFDRELIELRDAINDARLEDVPALVAEMERLREVSNRLAQVPTGKLDTDSPYFGHMRLVEGAKVRDVLIGNSTYINIDKAVRIVDWRDAPVSRVYYRYAEGDDFEEEFGGNILEGKVTLRRAVVIREGVLRRVVAPQGVFFRSNEQWKRGADSSAKLEGGQLSAVRPPTEEERQQLNARKRGKLGIGAENGGGREDRHLPEIPALIDPRQFELITKPSSGLVVIQGGAGSGKTTIGLHRMAFLAFNSPKRFAPDRMMVVVFNRALASYIVRVLPALGVAGVAVTTYSEWISKQRVRHIQGSPSDYTEETPPVVSRLKKHPVMLKLIAARVVRETAKALTDLLAAAKRNECDDKVQKVWNSLDNQPISRRLSGIGQWLRGERQVSGVSNGPLLGARTVAEIQRVVDRLMRRARDVAWDWAELITDGDAIWNALQEETSGSFTRAEIAQAVRWSAERCIKWVGVEPPNSDDAPKEERAEAKRDKPRSAKERDEPSSREAVEGRGAVDDADLGETRVRTRSERRKNDDDDDDRGGDDDDHRGPATGVDGVVEGDDALTLDYEDDALLMRIYQVKRGGLRGKGQEVLRYEHLFVDEAQDLSPVELSTLMGCASEDQSVTLAGDTAQRLLMDNGFTEWRDVLTELGLNSVEVEPLRIGYRSTQEVLVFAREVLGPLADPEPPVATRSGAPVEFYGFADVGAAVAFLGESLRTLSLSEPRANVAVITRDPERAKVYYEGLKQSEVPRLAWVQDQEFSFRPGVEVTDIRQVKGLEFDYVILVDVNAATYTVDDESRHLLHIGATRAAHQLWVVAAGTPSKLIPKYLLDD